MKRREIHIKSINFHLPFEVIHDNIGFGMAVAFKSKGKDTYLVVEFGERTLEFIYPGQFCFHLRAVHEEIQAQLLRDLADKYPKIWEVVADQKETWIRFKAEKKIRRKKMDYQQKMGSGFSVGSRAIDTYDRCCELFHFKRDLRGKFAPQQMLYAKNATPEGFSVWMLAHSNLNEHFHNNNNWFNIFVSPDTLKEIWFSPDDIQSSQSDYSYRVCFAKNRQGRYVFQGIFEPQQIRWEEIHGRQRLVRTFKRVSQCYPLGKNLFSNGPLLYASPEEEELSEVVDGCTIKARILESNKKTTVEVDLKARPFQRELLGKKPGDQFCLPKVNLHYEIEKIFE